MSKKVQQFKRDSDERLKTFYKENPNCERFVVPAFTDCDAQERMMRIGIEARALNADNEDDFYLIAVATLQNDFLRHTQ